MKYLVVAYIDENELLNDLESIMEFHQFKMIESNNHYRVFSGQYKGDAKKFGQMLNNELEQAIFKIEDSIFVAYPVLNPDGRPGLANLIIKRKGNKYLRNSFHS